MKTLHSENVRAIREALKVIDRCLEFERYRSILERALSRLTA